MAKSYIEPTEAAAIKLFSQDIKGPVVMLNMIRFHETADYSNLPEIAPENPTTGAEAYEIYMKETLPFLGKSGGELLFSGRALDYFIGPEAEQWDHVLLVKQNSLADFMAFASNGDYLKIVGHRTAATADSRLLPLLSV